MADRFWGKTEKTETCWLWTDPLTANGYGHFTPKRGISMQAHRVAWELANGIPVPDGLWVLHHCDIRHCVNPAHLYAGTRADNVRDAVERGRLPHNKGEKSPAAKLKDQQLVQIRRLYKTGMFLQIHLADMFGVTQSHISDITCGKTGEQINDIEPPIRGFKRRRKGVPLRGEHIAIAQQGGEYE